MEPQAPDELRSRGPIRIDEGVVVALEHVAAVVNRDDPMEDDSMDKHAPVADNVANAVRVLRA